MRAAFAAVAFAVLQAVATSAHAQPSEPDKAATEAFQRGKGLFEEGKLADALPELQRAAELSGSPNARLYVGRCLKELGRSAEAYDELRVAMRDAAALADKDPKYTKTRDAAASLVAILEPKLGKVVVVVAGANAGATVKLGARVLRPEELGTPIVVEPGTVVAAIDADGKHGERSVVVAAGESVSVVLELAEPAAKPAVIAPVVKTRIPAQPTSPPVESGGGVRIAGFVIGSLGVAGLATFAVAGGLVLDRQSFLDTECGGHCPDDSQADVIDEGRTLQIVANTGLGVGAALLGASIFMVAFGGPDEESPATARVWITPTGARTVITF